MAEVMAGGKGEGEGGGGEFARLFVRSLYVSLFMTPPLHTRRRLQCSDRTELACGAWECQGVSPSLFHPQIIARHGRDEFR